MYPVANCFCELCGVKSSCRIAQIFTLTVAFANSACIYRTLANLLFAEMSGVPTSLLRNGVDDEFGMWLKSLPNDYHIRVFVQRLARKFYFYLLRSELEDGICAMPVSKTLRHFLMSNERNSLLRREFGKRRSYTIVSTLPCRSCRVNVDAACAA